MNDMFTYFREIQSLYGWSDDQLLEHLAEIMDRYEDVAELIVKELNLGPP